jgi:hypothetical protein
MLDDSLGERWADAGQSCEIVDRGRVDINTNVGGPL